MNPVDPVARWEKQRELGIRATCMSHISCGVLGCLAISSITSTYFSVISFYLRQNSDPKLSAERFQTVESYTAYSIITLFFIGLVFHGCSHARRYAKEEATKVCEKIWDCRRMDTLLELDRKENLVRNGFINRKLFSEIQKNLKLREHNPAAIEPRLTEQLWQVKRQLPFRPFRV